MSCANLNQPGLSQVDSLVSTLNQYGKLHAWLQCCSQFRGNWEPGAAGVRVDGIGAVGTAGAAGVGVEGMGAVGTAGAEGVGVNGIGAVGTAGAAGVGVDGIGAVGTAGLSQVDSPV